MLVPSFDIENETRGKKNRLTGFIISIIIHSAILLMLFFLFITPPNPPMQDNEGGMSVNYGTSTVGSGDEQQFTTVPVTVQQPAETAPVNNPQSAKSQEDLETQNTEDAPVVEKKVETKKPKEKPNPNALFTPKSNNTTAPKDETPKPTVNKNALFSSGAVGKPNRSHGDGEGGGQGDQGDPNGDPNSRNYHGGGNGNGTTPGGDGLGSGNIRLTGRKLRNRPPVKNPCETARGKVVITISVNRSGHVTDTKFALNGSTTSDDCLVATARQAAMKYSFDENPNAAETQTGSITFIFKED